MDFIFLLTAEELLGASVLLTFKKNTPFHDLSSNVLRMGRWRFQFQSHCYTHAFLQSIVCTGYAFKAIDMDVVYNMAGP